MRESELLLKLLTEVISKLRGSMLRLTPHGEERRRRAFLVAWKFWGLVFRKLEQAYHSAWDRGRLYHYRRIQFFHGVQQRLEIWVRFMLWRWRRARDLASIAAARTPQSGIVPTKAPCKALKPSLTLLFPSTMGQVEISEIVSMLTVTANRSQIVPVIVVDPLCSKPGSRR